MMKYGILKTRRTEEERLRRRLHGDAGARFKLGKEPYIYMGGGMPDHHNPRHERHQTD